MAGRNGCDRPNRVEGFASEAACSYALSERLLHATGAHRTTSATTEHPCIAGSPESCLEVARTAIRAPPYPAIALQIRAHYPANEACILSLEASLSSSCTFGSIWFRTRRKASSLVSIVPFTARGSSRFQQNKRKAKGNT